MQIEGNVTVLWAHDDPPSTADVYQFNLLDDMSEIQLKETEL